MNLKEYISSGIVESYVLGVANNAERAEFESMCQAHPEVEAARIAFEAVLETYAFNHAVPPPYQLKQKLLGNLGPDQSIET